MEQLIVNLPAELDYTPTRLLEDGEMELWLVAQNTDECFVTSACSLAA